MISQWWITKCKYKILQKIVYFPESFFFFFLTYCIYSEHKNLLFCLILVFCLVMVSRHYQALPSIMFTAARPPAPKNARHAAPARMEVSVRAKGSVPAPLDGQYVFNLNIRVLYTYWSINNMVCVQTSIFTLVQMPDHLQSAVFSWLIDKKVTQLWIFILFG